MKKNFAILLLIVISVISGSLITLGGGAYFATKIKYKYMDFSQIEGDVTFKNFSVSQELDSKTNTPSLYLKRKGECFGIIVADSNGVDSVLLADPNNRMTFLLSFEDNDIGNIGLEHDGKLRAGAIYDAHASDWGWAWRYNSDPNDSQTLFVDIDWDGLDDIKRVISSTGEETGQFIFCEKNWIRVNEYGENEDGGATAEIVENKYIFNKTSGLWHIEKPDPNR